MTKIKTVMCIASNVSELIDGMIYNVLNEYSDSYEIVDSNGVRFNTKKEYFIEI